MIRQQVITGLTSQVLAFHVANPQVYPTSCGCVGSAADRRSVARSNHARGSGLVQTTTSQAQEDEKFYKFFAIQYKTTTYMDGRSYDPPVLRSGTLRSMEGC